MFRDRRHFSCTPDRSAVRPRRGTPQERLPCRRQGGCGERKCDRERKACAHRATRIHAHGRLPAIVFLHICGNRAALAAAMRCYYGLHSGCETVFRSETGSRWNPVTKTGAKRRPHRSHPDTAIDDINRRFSVPPDRRIACRSPYRRDRSRAISAVRNLSRSSASSIALIGWPVCLW